MAIKPTDPDDGSLPDDALRHVSVMNDEGLTYGLPSQLFWGGIVLSLAFSFLLSWVIGVLFAAVYFTAMYSIHKDDSKALKGWVDAALRRRLEVWSGGINKSRKIYYIDNKD